MTAQRWWDIAFAGALAIMVAIAGFGYAASPSARLGAVVTLAVIGGCYGAFGRRALDHRTSSIVFRVLLIVGTGVATAFTPNMATVQALVFPFLWVLTESILMAIVLSGLLSLSVGLGFAISLGGTVEAVLQALSIEGISFVFAVALGLWINQIARDGATQRRLLEELTAAQGELAVMHRDAGTVSERERLAREIHDTIAQDLTSLVMLAQRTRSELAAVPADTSAPETTIDLVEATAREALAEARTLVVSMSAVHSAGADSSLAETLARLADRFERETGIQVDSSVRGGSIDRELEVVLLRCAQEGLANVRKHSRAGVASVSLERGRGEVTLEVRDNGRGVGAYSADRETGFGIAGMRDRVGLVGGRLEVADSEAGGTVLRVIVQVVEPIERSTGDSARGRLEAAPDGTDPDRVDHPERRVAR
jgi:signal transduction histidine kinase